MSCFLLGSDCVTVDSQVASVVVLDSTAGGRQTALNVRKATVERMTKSVWLGYLAALSEEEFTALRVVVWVELFGLPHRPSCGENSPGPG